MVSLRLARAGGKKKPYYQVVAADSQNPRDGRFIEEIGAYDPRAKKLSFVPGRYEHWLGVGARPSVTVQNLWKRARRAEAAKPA